MEVIEGDRGNSHEDIHDLGVVLWDYFKCGNYSAALEEIQTDKHHDYITHNSLELVPVVTKLLTENVDSEGEDCISSLLKYIAQVAHHKEALLAFLEEMEIFKSEAHFRVMLPPIQTSLLKAASVNTKPSMFKWTYNTLYSHICQMDLPKNYSLEGKDRLMLDVDPSAQALLENLKSLRQFYTGFVDVVLSGKLIWTNININSEEFLAYYILQFFEKPLTYLDIYCSEGMCESSLYRVSQDFVMLVCKLVRNPFKLLAVVKWKERKCEDEDTDCKDDNSETEVSENLVANENISQLSLATYFYCILGLDFSSNLIPQVYCKQFLYLSCLPLLSTLLQEKSLLSIHKGVIFCNRLLDTVAEMSLTADTLEAEAHLIFSKLLIVVMTGCNSEECRIGALKAFKKLLRRFDMEGRYKLLTSLFHSTTHAGVFGLLIHEVKENVVLCLQEVSHDSFYFKGDYLKEIVGISCHLASEERTDLLEASDQVMAALNLLIYIYLRDRDDVLGMRTFIPRIKETFLEPLQKGLDLSRGHYELKAKELKENTKKVGSELKVSVNVGGSLLPNLPPDQEIKVVEAALCTFDMTSCVLARLEQVLQTACHM
ncbi:glomulin-like isoform X1 [Oratosquilla oratoria]|uniref:glomulin-like isoform X1 n=1 Tax=Oratosquilla oratoria TaxID=337810 RepID=UPI003F7734F1